MKIYSAILYIAMVLCIISQSNCIYGQSKVDSIFVKWNKTTLQSLERQKLTAIDNKQKGFYENRLRSVKAYWKIDSIQSVNKKSIRYDFLTAVFSKYNTKQGDLFVLEADESGYMVTLRNFILYIDSSHTANIDFYTFDDGKWSLKGRSKIKNFINGNNLYDYITSFGKGFNEDDIIITKFANDSPVSSEYFLTATLSGKCCFKDVIVSYKGENFIR